MEIAFAVELIIGLSVLSALVYHQYLVKTKTKSIHDIFHKASLEARYRHRVIYNGYDAVVRPMEPDEMEVRLGYRDVDAQVILPSVTMVIAPPISSEGGHGVLILRGSHFLQWKAVFKGNVCLYACVETLIMSSCQVLTDDDRSDLESLYISAMQQFTTALELKKNIAPDPDEERAIAES